MYSLCVIMANGSPLRRAIHCAVWWKVAAADFFGQILLAGQLQLVEQQLAQQGLAALMSALV
jgi:hypothetical protein